MFTDLTGKRRYKINLHCHSTRSDGRISYEEVLAAYARAGYDMLAVTDHWVWGEAGTFTGSLPDGTPQTMRILSGCEFNVGGGDSLEGVLHILGLDCLRRPALTMALYNDARLSPLEKARIVIKEIHRAGGVAVLAHPAWSLNTPEQFYQLGAYEATEIYNSVSAWGLSDRPYSGVLIDEVAARGLCLPLLATDDTHYYDGDQFRGMIMADADFVDSVGFSQMIRENRFYATMGPEVHLERVDEDTVRLRCTPAAKIVFLSNLVWTDGRVRRGSGLTEASYNFQDGETYVRAEVTDENGLTAWSRIEVR